MLGTTQESMDMLLEASHLNAIVFIDVVEE